MQKRVGLSLFLAGAFLLNGCGAKEQTMGKPSGNGKTPDFVTVQHILVGFDGSLPDKDVSRTQEQAEALAQDLYTRASSGEDFDLLVEEYTDDSFPGVYQMANKDKDADPTRTIFARKQMAKNFGDVSFALAVGEVGLAVYDPNDCKYGWHVIVRIE